MSLRPRGSRPSAVPVEDPILIPLAEVASRTGGTWTERSLREECKRGEVDHVHRNGQYGFTPEQLDKLIARYTRKAEAGASAAESPADELEAARQFNAERQKARGQRQTTRARSAA